MSVSSICPKPQILLEGVTEACTCLLCRTQYTPAPQLETPVAVELGVTHQVTVGAVPELDQSFEKAKIDAAKSGWTISRNIQNYGIIDQDKLFEIAKIAAAESGVGTSEYIQNYGIIDQDKLFEIAKIAAAQSGWGTSEYIQNYRIQDLDKRFEIAKIAAAESGPGISSNFSNFNITDQNKRFEIAKIAAAYNSERTSDSILNYALCEEQQLKILHICLKSIVHAALEAHDFSHLLQFVSRHSAHLNERLYKVIFQIYYTMETPFYFETTEKHNIETDLKAAFDQLKDIAIQRGASEQVLASLEETIFKKHTSLQQHKDLSWLIAWVANHALDTDIEALKHTPLGDPAMTPLLNSILKTINPTLRGQATNALIRGYNDSEKMESLKILMQQHNEERLYLLILFSTMTGIRPEMTKKICEELPKTKYKDPKLMAPINELMGAINKNASLSLEETQKILKLIFNPPVKGERESKPDFNARLSEYRNKRNDWIAAVHSLLYFSQEALLKKVTNTSDLIKEWQAFMGATFHIKADVLDQFFPTFGHSQRCPNGLITYATRLQTLSETEIQQLMPLLGKFANGVLDNTFSKMRYDLTGNLHLTTLFSENAELLNRWQTPLQIKIDNQGETVEEKTPQERIQKLMQNALKNHHLGEDQDKMYPELKAILGGNFETPIKAGDRWDVLRHCATVLNPKTELAELQSALIELQKLFHSKDVQFHHDLKSMAAQFETTQSSVPFTIEDTDAWEDLLLMGTEVHDSCQSIHRNPSTNRCLLASSLDGKIRLMVARETGTGKLLGRVVLRIMQDVNKKPVLFIETLYTRYGVNSQHLKQNIIEGCRQKALSMGVALTASTNDYGDLSIEKYPGALESLGGPAPYEYVDAIEGQANDSIYSIPESYLLWAPPSNQPDPK